jgi:beta-phosphoglucomutase
MDAQMPLENISAILFDLDGTLIDSETITDRAVGELLTQHNIDTKGLDFLQFHGISWQRLELILKERYTTLADVEILGYLEKRFYEISKTEPPPLLPGARETFLAANAQVPTAIVTGSGAADVEAFLDRADLRHACSFYLSYEMYSPSKPDPSCYLMAAERLNLPPDQCLVFEDSLPGLSAARTAGMPTIALTYSSPPPPPGLADRMIEDYTHLPVDFFHTITT